MPRTLLLLLCIVLLLSGCPAKKGADSDSGKTSGSGTNVNDAGADTGAPPVAAAPAVEDAPSAPPRGWPDFLPLYPGSQYTGGSRKEGGRKVELMVSLLTEAAADDVTKFYGEKAKAAGFLPTAEDRGSKGVISTFLSPEHFLTVSVTVAAPRQITLVLTNEGGTPVSPPVVDYSGQEQLPPDFPGSLSVYPGATVVTATTMGGVATLSMRTTASADKVQEHYRERLTAAGFATASSNVTEDASTVEYRGPDAMVIVSCGPVPQGMGGAGGSTSALVTLSPLPRAPEAR